MMVGIGTASNLLGGERQFWPERRWWLVILVLAGTLRYPGYDFSLPVIDIGDEAHHSLSGRYVIDTGSARALGQDGYPQGIIRLYYLILRFFQEPGSPTTSVIWIVRLLAITTSLGIVVVLALLGYHTLGPPYGLLGAAFWTITPFFVERSRWATAGYSWCSSRRWPSGWRSRVHSGAVSAGRPTRPTR